MSQPSQMVVYQNPNDLKKFLESGRSVIAAALPKHLNPDRMLRLALTAFSTTPALRECTGHSILASIVLASQIGLEPGVAGQGYLIPYGKNCTFVPGWQGLVGLLNNTGRATVWSHCVYEGDTFDFALGTNERLHHIPGENYGDEAKMTWVYACGKVNGSEQAIVEAWPMARVWRHRDKFNKVGAKHYSYRNPEMYARKVVVLQVLKYMPKSIEVTNAITAENAAEGGRTARVEDGMVIDIDGDAGGMASGNIGQASITELVQSGDSQGNAPAGEQTIKPSGEPTPDGLLTSIVAKGNEINAGKGKIEKTLIAMKYLEPHEKLDVKLGSKRLADVLDAWSEIKDAITNPDAAR